MFEILISGIIGWVFGSIIGLLIWGYQSEKEHKKWMKENVDGYE